MDCREVAVSGTERTGWFRVGHGEERVEKSTGMVCIGKAVNGMVRLGLAWSAVHRHSKERAERPAWRGAVKQEQERQCRSGTGGESCGQVESGVFRIGESW